MRVIEPSLRKRGVRNMNNPLSPRLWFIAQAQNLAWHPLNHSAEILLYLSPVRVQEVDPCVFRHRWIQRPTETNEPAEMLGQLSRQCAQDAVIRIVVAKGHNENFVDGREPEYGINLG
jgi:hypothetical protein